MTDPVPPFSPRAPWLTLIGLLLVGAVVFCIGITWGLPSRAVDPYLFGDHELWSGEKIARLAGGWTDDPTRGADVDVDPLGKTTTQPIILNATDARRAEIIRRYRLYTYQPDEMITMRALASMQPGQGKLDPRLYQYGGLWIYPVGALLKLASVAGLITLKSDVTWYLDHPEEFGKFYVVARAYSAAWGLVGVGAVFWIVRRCTRGALLPAVFAALCYIAMPVIINMAHEAKPHLPGAVLQLLAIMTAMKYVETRRNLWWLATAILCGASFGMVLSAWPIFILLPLIACFPQRAAGFSPRGVPTEPTATPPSTERPPPAPSHLLTFATLRAYLTRVTIGTALALAVYLLTNPYIVINLFMNRAVLESNFGNSLAMYEIGRWREGLINAADLIAEGTSYPLAIASAIAVVVILFESVRRVFSRREQPASGHNQTKRLDDPSNLPAPALKGPPSIAQDFSPESSTQPPTTPALKGRQNNTAQDRIRAALAPIDMLILTSPAALIALQFVALAAGKPGEYGRFAVLPDVVLCIAAGVGLARVLRDSVTRSVGFIGLWAIVAVQGFVYLHGFLADAGACPGRLIMAQRLDELSHCGAKTLSTIAEPAPYVLPPVNLFTWEILLVPSPAGWAPGDADVLAGPVDALPGGAAMTGPPTYFSLGPQEGRPRHRISWADKPMGGFYRAILNIVSQPER